MPAKPPKSSPPVPNTPSETTLNLSEVPAIYADNVLAVSIGPFVSKIVLAMESTPPPQAKPSVQIVIPSNVLQAIASQVLNIMGQPAVKEQITQSHTTFVESLP